MPRDEFDRMISRSWHSPARAVNTEPDEDESPWDFDRFLRRVVMIGLAVIVWALIFGAIFYAFWRSADMQVVPTPTITPTLFERGG